MEKFCYRKEESGCCLLSAFYVIFLSAGARPSIMDPYFKRQCLHSSLSSQDEEFGIAGQHFDFCEHCSCSLDHGSPWHLQRTSHTQECFLRQHLLKLLEKIKSLSPFWNTLSTCYQNDAVKYDLRRVPRPRQMPKWYKYPLRG